MAACGICDRGKIRAADEIAVLCNGIHKNQWDTAVFLLGYRYKISVCVKDRASDHWFATPDGSLAKLL
jgi:hypothetical protein